MNEIAALYLFAVWMNEWIDIIKTLIVDGVTPMMNVIGDIVIIMDRIQLS